MAGAIARQVVGERAVEQPMHTLDAPMAACSLRETLDVERRGGDEEAGVAGAFVRMLGAILDFEDGLDVREARRARIAALRRDPVHPRGGGEGARLEAPVTF